MIKTLNILRAIVYLGFTILVSGMVFNGRLSGLPYALIPAAIFTAAFFAKSKTLDKIVGYLMATGSAYMLISVSSQLPKVEKVTAQTFKFFGFGYGIFGLSFAAALFLFYYHGKLNKAEAKKNIA